LIDKIKAEAFASADFLGGGLHGGEPCNPLYEKSFVGGSDVFVHL